LTGRFEFIGGADLSAGRSSKADVIAHSLTALGVDPVPATTGGTAGALMIGDRSHDVEGAAHYGIPTAIVRWGYGSAIEWESARRSESDTTELEEIIRARSTAPPLVSMYRQRGPFPNVRSHEPRGSPDRR